MKEFKINEYLTVKLEEGKTNIYVSGTLFNQCKYLMVNKPTIDTAKLEEIESIDDVIARLGWGNQGQEGVEYRIDSDSEFWGHCSNLQVWAENNYDSRLLHSYLAFPLLKKLTDNGDMIAQKILGDEIVKRLESGDSSAYQFLEDQDYMNYIPKSYPYIYFRGISILKEDVKALIEIENGLNSSIEDFYFESVNKFEYNDVLHNWDEGIPGLFYVNNKKIEVIALMDNNYCDSCNNYEEVETDSGEYVELEPDCSKCGFNELPSSLSKLDHLKELYLKGNSSVSNNLPDWIQNIETLETLYLDAIGSSNLPSILAKLTNLKVLMINNYALGEIPASLLLLKKLKRLDLRYSGINSTVWRGRFEVLKYLTQLESLYLDGNYLEELPNMNQLKHLKVLSIRKWNKYSIPLKAFPNSICDVTTLKELYLDGNTIKYIPKAIERLINLEVLSLSNTKITTLPESIGNLKKLKVLNVKNCMLRSLPESLMQKSSLKTLNIEGNFLPEISQETATLENIPQKDKLYLQMDRTEVQALYEIETKTNKKLKQVRALSRSLQLWKSPEQNEYVLENHHVSALRLNYISYEIPESIQNLKHLKVLEINSGYELSNSTIPSFFGKLENLESLKLSSMGITAIANLEKLVQLKTLDLPFNKIKKIKGLDTLTKLSRLILTSNEISEVGNLDSLTHLTELDLKYNKISEIKGLDNLHNLTKLELNHNNIEEIKGLDNLHKLTDLDLCNNNIKEIKGLENLTDLRGFGFYGNKFPSAIIDQIIDNVSDHRDKFVYYCQRNVVKSKKLNYEFVSVKGKKYYVWNKKLRIYKENLTSIDEIKGLEKLKDIEVLDLSSNKIREIKGLDNLIYLKKLDLSGNEIGEIKGLDKLTCLESLDLSVNKIREIKGLDTLHNLKKLLLYNNSIGDLIGIGHLNNLEELSIHLSERFWNDLKDLMGDEYYNEIGVSYRGLHIKNLEKLMEFCKLKEKKLKNTN